MTIGFGAACRDGVVLAVDSMYFTWSSSPEGVVTGRAAGDEKLRWAGDRVAFVPSGSFFSDRPWGGGDVSTPTARSVGDFLWPQLLEHRVRTPQVNTLATVELLVGGGLLDSLPELFRYDSSAERVVCVPIGSVAVVGNMAFDNPEPVRRVDDDLTTDVALGLAISECHAYVRKLYRGFGRRRLGEFSGACGAGGPLPPAAFPLNIGVVTQDETHRYVVSLPGDITRADVEAATNDASAVGQDGARARNEGGVRDEAPDHSATRG